MSPSSYPMQGHNALLLGAKTEIPVKILELAGLSKCHIGGQTLPLGKAAIIRRQHAKQSVFSVERSGSRSLLTECHDLLQSLFWRFALIIRCHQLPERSFSFRNRQVPLCARCLGISVGALAIPLYVHDLQIAASLIGAMVLDGGTQALGLRTSKNWIRFVSGIGFS